MSGGGTFGSYEAGVLWGLYFNDKDKSKYEYDVVTGVSAGSINLGALALFAKGDEKNMIEVMSETWQILTEDQLIGQWKPLGVITGFFEKTGLLDTQPLHDFVTKFYAKYGPEIKRMIAISAVDADSGSVLIFNETTSDPIKAVMSSAAIPFAFPS